MDKKSLFKRLSFLISFLLICSCVTSLGYKYSLVKPAQVDSTTYKDDLVGITIIPDYYNLNLSVENMTQEAIKVNIDEAYFIDTTGVAHKVFSGKDFDIYDYYSKDKPQSPWLVPPGLKFADILIPVDYVWWQRRIGRPYWANKELLDCYSDQICEFGVSFPIEIKGVKKTYTLKVKRTPINE